MAGFTVEYGLMAEPSLLCVNCFKPPPEGRSKWQSCVRCAKLKLPATYYCSEECMNAHWPQHKQYHKAQKERTETWDADETGERSIAEALAEMAEERPDNEGAQAAAQAWKLMTEGDLRGAAKAWRKIIETWPRATQAPYAYFCLARTLNRSGRYVEAAQMFLKSMELHEEDTVGWATAASDVFQSLLRDECDEVPKPEWWNEEAIKALSARIVAAVPDDGNAQVVRGLALSGHHKLSWGPGTSTAAELKEAARCFRRADMGSEELASELDRLADEMLAKEEAEAVAARAAAEAEAAAARKAAEEKAEAAAEELLADEEKEKHQAAARGKAGQAKQSKGKKGKGQGKR